jgi:hypothetical protein
MDSPLEFDSDDLPFSQEDDIDDIVWPKREDYQKQLDKYKDKVVGSITILKKDDKEMLSKMAKKIFLQQSPTPLP